jgi:hypothetical protein
VLWVLDGGPLELLLGQVELAGGDAVVDPGQGVGWGVEGFGAFDAVGGAVGDDGAGTAEPCGAGWFAGGGCAEFADQPGGWLLGELEQGVQLAAA